MKTLLLVEDSDLIRNRMMALLTRIKGLSRVHCAPTLEVAQDIVQSKQPDLVVLDLSLPDGNGMHWIRMFKSLSPRTAIAVFTNDATEFSRNKCLAAGAQWFFDKSADCDALVALVAQQCTQPA
jgi:DNA-binding NarL/FixJ family response regulator